MTKIVSIQGQQKWEYCLETRYTEIPLMAALNERGQQGWEVLDVLNYKDAKGKQVWTAFLKRPCAGPAPAPEQQTAASAAPNSDGQPVGQPGQPQGFDLSEKEFELKKE
jgi:hypothetical protein